MGANGKLKIGVIGAGRIGKLHTENLAMRIGETDVVSIADVNIEEANSLAEKFAVKFVTKNYKDIISNPEIDAVVICSPTNTHSQYIQEAAAAGKHIFCEKPVDLSLDAINKAIDAVEKAGVKLLVGFNRRFDPNFSKIQEYVKAGKIGEPHIIKITSRDPAPPNIEYVKISGGIFLDMTIHDFDMARFLSGSEVVEVYARGNVLVEPGIGKAGDIDTAVITLTFENGAIGIIDNSRKAVYGYDQRAEVFGSKGMVNTGNNKPDNHFYYNDEGEHASLPLYFFMQRYMESYYIEMKAFVDGVLCGREMPVSGNDGLQSVAMGLAAKKSYAENRPVKISEILS